MAGQHFQEQSQYELQAGAYHPACPKGQQHAPLSTESLLLHLLPPLSSVSFHHMQSFSPLYGPFVHQVTLQSAVCHRMCIYRPKTFTCKYLLMAPSHWSGSKSLVSEAPLILDYQCDESPTPCCCPESGRSCNWAKHPETGSVRAPGHCTSACPQ